jgi:hypothetical protein
MPPSSTSSLKLRPADPFDLIRWLARSQSDPRKAIAELVQNSLDANARRVTIERRRVRRLPALVIRDDGEGIVPESPREEALRAIATNIGHSRKRGLSPRERHDQIVAGKYGIGLLGFWSVGHRMEIRSRVGGGDVWTLRMIEDQERADLVRDRMAFETADTFTEVVISELHGSAQRLLTGRRINDYLASELRGVLLATGAGLEIRDRLARGLAERTFTVVPRRFVGERLTLPDTAPVDGYPPARIELYLARGGDRAAIEVSCAGTLVADDAGELRAEGLDRSPWVSRGLTGLIEFPAFQIPPGTRRGIVPDPASEAFARAMAEYAPLIEAELTRLDRERQATTSRQLLAELRRALRGLRARLPQYELPKVEASGVLSARAEPIRMAGATPEGLPLTTSGDDVRGTAADASELVEEDEPSLFPPGPVVSVRVVPAEIAVPPGRERRVQVVALDRNGRRAAGVAFSWSSDSGAVAVVGEGVKPLVRAQPDARPGLRVLVTVLATQGEARAQGVATVVVADRAEPAPDLTGGIPEPELVDDPGGRWRSRFDGQRWQVNGSHDDYIALRGEPRTRLRYLLALFAKEVAFRAHGVPGSEDALESLVEILAHAERNLASS